MRRYRVAAALLPLGLAVAPAWAGGTLDRVSETGTVTDILVNDYPPFSYIDDNNQLAGFDVDVAKAFAHKIGSITSSDDRSRTKLRRICNDGANLRAAASCQICDKSAAVPI